MPKKTSHQETNDSVGNKPAPNVGDNIPKPPPVPVPTTDPGFTN